MPGQMYVAMSRVTSFAGLFLIGNYTKAVFTVNNAAANEYERLRVEQAVSLCKLNETVLPEKLVISLLNVRSLKAVSAIFLLVCFLSLKESTFETRKNVFIPLHKLFSFSRKSNFRILDFQIS